MGSRAPKFQEILEPSTLARGILPAEQERARSGHDAREHPRRTQRAKGSRPYEANAAVVWERALMIATVLSISFNWSAGDFSGQRYWCRLSAPRPNRCIEALRSTACCSPSTAAMM